MNSYSKHVASRISDTFYHQRLLSGREFLEFCEALRKSPSYDYPRDTDDCGFSSYNRFLIPFEDFGNFPEIPILGYNSWDWQIFIFEARCSSIHAEELKDIFNRFESDHDISSHGIDIHIPLYIEGETSRIKFYIVPPQEIGSAPRYRFCLQWEATHISQLDLHAHGLDTKRHRRDRNLVKLQKRRSVVEKHLTFLNECKLDQYCGDYSHGPTKIIDGEDLWKRTLEWCAGDGSRFTKDIQIIIGSKSPYQSLKLDTTGWINFLKPYGVSDIAFAWSLENIVYDKMESRGSEFHSWLEQLSHFPTPSGRAAVLGMGYHGKRSRVLECYLTPAGIGLGVPSRGGKSMDADLIAMTGGEDWKKGSPPPDLPLPRFGCFGEGDDPFLSELEFREES